MREREKEGRKKKEKRRRMRRIKEMKRVGDRIIQWHEMIRRHVIWEWKIVGTPQSEGIT